MGYFLIMKNILTILVIFLFSSTTWGEWFKYESNRRNGITYYIDTDEIIINENYIFAWDLLNLDKSLKSGVISFKGYKEYDCNNFRYKELKLQTYTQPMGKGNIHEKIPIIEGWLYAEPNTIFEALIEQVCSFTD